MSIPNDFSTYEKMANMKNFLGGSVVEILKQNIKSKQNENVKKMLDFAKEKPETYMELVAVAIFHQNLDIIKHMIEKFKITEVDIPYINAISFYNGILKDNSKEKINDPKESYLDIQCPFVLMSGIGGDIEIFQYLLNQKLIRDKNQIGVIGLTKKFKNSFSSNIIGACAYYGKDKLLEFLLKNYGNELSLDILTSEKKSKTNSKFGFSREYTGFTPVMLSIIGPSTDLQTLEILKIFKNYNIKFDITDSNKDNLLHLATKNQKIETAKFLVEDLDLKSLINETNKDGYTPLSLAQHLNYDIFISYLSDKIGIDEKEIEKNIRELIGESETTNQSSKNKKKKKNKRYKYNENNENIPNLVDSSEYQETLKVEKEEPQKESNNNKTNTQTNKKTTTTTHTKNYSSNTYNSYNNRGKLRSLLDNVKNKKKKEIRIEKQEEKIDTYNENNEDKKEIKEEEKDLKEDEKEEDIKDSEKEKEKEKENKKRKNNETSYDEGIIGLSKKNKKNKKGKGKIKNKDNENENNDNLNKEKEEEEKRKKEEEEQKEKEKEEKRIKEEEEKRIKEEEEKRRKEEEEEQKRIKEEEEEREREEQRKKEEEEEREREREREEQRRKEEELRKIEEEKRKKEEEKRRKMEEERRRKEEEERKREEEEEKKRKEEEKKKKVKESKNEEEEEEDEEEYSYSDEENFLEEKEEEKKVKTNNQPVSQEDYNKLNSKYLELERKIAFLEKEKEELSSCLKKLYLENKSISKIPISSNNEENINDLLTLANKELENKNNTIQELNKKVSMVDLRNIENFSKEKLKECKEFYSKNLKLINDAMKQY